MKKEVTTTTITCDLCGLPTPDPWNGVSEERPVGFISMAYDVWYGGTYDVKDICKECQNKLSAFMRQHGMIAKAQKRR